MSIAIDFETHLISKDSIYPKPVCLSYYDGEKAGIKVGLESMGRFLEKVLKGEMGGTVIAHNAMFEMGVIYFHFPHLRELLLKSLRNFYCTQLSEKYITYDKLHNYSLSALVKKYFEEDISAVKKGGDAWRLRYKELEGVPLEDWPKEAVDYAIDDSIYAYKIYKEQGFRHFSDLSEQSFFFNMMGVKGIHVDTNRVKELKTEVLSKLQPLYDKLIASGFCVQVEGKGLPKKEIKKLREHVKSLPIMNYDYTKKGDIQIGRESLKKYYEITKDETLGLFEQVAEYEKLVTSYVPNLNNPIIYTKYDIMKATGRTSSQKDRFYPSIAIQQMPRAVEGVKWDVRNCFVPRKGYVMAALDYRTLEIVSVACQLNKYVTNPKMIKILNQGDEPVDTHSYLASYIMSTKEGINISYEEFLKNKKKPDYKYYRTIAKTINCGFPGGIGYDVMAHQLAKAGVSLKYSVLCKYRNEKTAYRDMRKINYPNLRVKRLTKQLYAIVYDELVGLKEMMFRTYPDLQEFLQDTHKHFLNGGHKWVRNGFGELEKEPLYNYTVGKYVRKDCTYTEFCNGILMQTPSAFGAKNAILEILKKYFKDDRLNPLAFIHDEILLETKDEQLLRDVASIMVTKMKEALGDVRIAVEGGVMDYWSKSNVRNEFEVWE